MFYPPQKKLMTDYSQSKCKRRFKTYKPDVKELDGVAIMADTDNSKMKAEVIIKILFSE